MGKRDRCYDGRVRRMFIYEQLYRNHDMDILQIANKFGVKGDTVVRAIKKARNSTPRIGPWFDELFQAQVSADLIAKE